MPHVLMNFFFSVKYGHVQFSYKEEECWGRGGCGRLPEAAVTAELPLHKEKLQDLQACFWRALYQENLLLERGIQVDHG